LLERKFDHEPSRPKRVLVVEDEPDALETLQLWAQTHGWEVRAVQTGAAALETNESFRPDVVITDYLLKDEVNGVDVIVQLRKSGHKMRCVLVTGMLDAALLEGVCRIHGVPILVKPFDFERLAALISR
jgi:two-component system OmpR family response regulator